MIRPVAGKARKPRLSLALRYLPRSTRGCRAPGSPVGKLSINVRGICSQGSPHDPRVRQLDGGRMARLRARSEEHTSELQSLMRISYAVFCLKNKKATRY